LSATSCRHKHACFHCQVCFRRPEAARQRCQLCGGETFQVPYTFEAPRKGDAAGWKAAILFLSLPDRIRMTLCETPRMRYDDLAAQLFPKEWAPLAWRAEFDGAPPALEKALDDALEAAGCAVHWKSGTRWVEISLPPKAP
jgi:hypothetical protein